MSLLRIHCGHEVSLGETVFLGEDDTVICFDCYEDEQREQSPYAAHNPRHPYAAGSLLDIITPPL